MAGRRCSGELYRVLDVEPDAPPAAVKKAYHKMALKYHPDKAGERFRAEFQLIQEAHEALSAAPRRKMYDQLGRGGMKALESGVGAPFAEVIAQHSDLIRWMLIVASWFCLLCIGFLGLLTAQVDKNRGWPWENIFVPIWLIDVVVVVSLGVLASELRKNPDTVFPFVSTIIGMCAFVAATITVCMALDGALSWPAAFLPVAVVLATYVFSQVRQLSFDTFRESLHTAGDPAADSVRRGSQRYVFHVVSILAKMLCIVAFVLLLFLRITGELRASYYLVFLPMFLFIGGPLLVRCYLIYQADDVMPTAKDKAFAMFSVIVSHTSSIMTVVLLAVKCHQHEAGVEQIPLGYVLIPTYVFLWTLFFTLCCMGLFFDPEQAMGGGPPGGGQQHPEDPTAPLHRGGQHDYGTRESAQEMNGYK
jgi:hypothetical protein